MPLILDVGQFRQEFPGESQMVEFKTGIGSEPIQNAVVSFSNADGGVILIGVDDDGEVKGRPLDSGAVDALHQILREVRDPGRYSLHELIVDETPIIVLSVARRREGFAQTSSGVVRVRKGTRDDSLFGADLQRLINERSATRYELTPTSMSLSAADSELLRPFAEAFGWAPGSVEERISQSDYTDEGRLTVAGALYLLADPGQALGKSHIEILRYREEDSIDYDLRLELRGPLPGQLLKAVERVSEELGTELVVLGVQRYELARIPVVVLREAIANALAHRSYELHRTPVRIELRPSAVTVTSPGGLPEPVTVENIRETSAPRNLAVIGALRRFGLAEDAGRGINVMEDTMLAEMLDPPRIEDRDHEVVVTLPVHSAVAPVERAWVRELERRGTLTGADRLVLVHAARGEKLTNSRVRDILQADQGKAREVLQHLRDANFLVQEGRRGGASYRLEGSLAPPAGLRLNAEELAALIENMAAEAPISNSDVREATGLERHQARALLSRLVDEGRLRVTGERRGTRYHAVDSS